jgi:hypothetical protein
MKSRRDAVERIDAYGVPAAAPCQRSEFRRRERATLRIYRAARKNFAVIAACRAVSGTAWMAAAARHGACFFLSHKERRASLHCRATMARESSMTVNSREWLVFVAIVASAIVLQIRQYTLDAKSAAAPPSAVARVTQEQICDPREGRASARVLPATCENMGGERRIDRRAGPPREARPRAWV